jgi:hypothetical protein
MQRCSRQRLSPHELRTSSLNWNTTLLVTSSYGVGPSRTSVEEPHSISLCPGTCCRPFLLSAVCLFPSRSSIRTRKWWLHHHSGLSIALPDNLRFDKRRRQCLVCTWTAEARGSHFMPPPCCYDDDTCLEFSRSARHSQPSKDTSTPRAEGPRRSHPVGIQETTIPWLQEDLRVVR